MSNKNETFEDYLINEINIISEQLEKIEGQHTTMEKVMYCMLEAVLKVQRKYLVEYRKQCLGIDYSIPEITIKHEQKLIKEVN